MVTSLAAATVLTALGAVAGGVPSASAATPPRSTAELTAQQHFKEGEVRYAARQFQAALDEYQAGFSILPLPGFLVNIGQCQRRMGDLPHARSTFQRFVLAAPDSPLVPEIRDLIAEIDRQQRSAYLDAPEVLPLSYANAESDQPEREAHVQSPVIAPTALHARPPSAALAYAEAHPRGALIDRPGVRATVTREDNAGDSGDTRSWNEDDNESTASPSQRSWWLWGGLAAAVIGGSVTAYLALSAPNTVVLHDGTLGALRR